MHFIDIITNVNGSKVLLFYEEAFSILRLLLSNSLLGFPSYNNIAVGTLLAHLFCNVNHVYYEETILFGFAAILFCILGITLFYLKENLTP